HLLAARNVHLPNKNVPCSNPLAPHTFLPVHRTQSWGYYHRKGPHEKPHVLLPFPQNRPKTALRLHFCLYIFLFPCKLILCSRLWFILRASEGLVLTPDIRLPTSNF